MVVDAVVVGAGQRGFHVYGAWAQRHSDRLRFVAVVDPNPDRLSRFGDAHGIPDERRYESTDGLWASGRIAQVCVIAGPDRMHEHAAVKSLEAEPFATPPPDTPAACTSPTCSATPPFSARSTR
jgi:predicted dehydrogenase